MVQRTNADLATQAYVDKTSQFGPDTALMTQDATQREGLALVKTDTLQIASSSAAFSKIEPIRVEGQAVFSNDVINLQSSKNLVVADAESPHQNRRRTSDSQLKVADDADEGQAKTERISVERKKSQMGSGLRSKNASLLLRDKDKMKTEEFTTTAPGQVQSPAEE